jgi:hypothetical protein
VAAVKSPAHRRGVPRHTAAQVQQNGYCAVASRIQVPELDTSVGEGGVTDPGTSMSFTVPTARSRAHRWPAKCCGLWSGREGIAEGQNFD